MSITLRPVTPDDEPFLYRTFASTRIDELAALGWDSAQQELFLRMQYNMQSRVFAAQHPEADHHIILYNDEPAGRLMVNRAESEMTMIDLALLPEYRGAGIGSFLIKELLAEALATNRPLRLHVLKSNTAAIRLYERLGFKVCADVQMYWRMECLPD